jgi:hypothetical protein
MSVWKMLPLSSDPSNTDEQLDVYLSYKEEEGQLLPVYSTIQQYLCSQDAVADNNEEGRERAVAGHNEEREEESVAVDDEERGGESVAADDDGKTRGGGGDHEDHESNCTPSVRSLTPEDTLPSPIRIQFTQSDGHGAVPKGYQLVDSTDKGYKGFMEQLASYVREAKGQRT